MDLKVETDYGSRRFRDSVLTGRTGRELVRLRLSLLLLMLTISTAVFVSTVKAQEISQAKSGVVRIANRTHGEVGAGFIVKIEDRTAYIVTASHVIRGESNPTVYLFTRPQEGLPAEILHTEEDEAKGLALLTVRLPSAAGLTALKLGPTSRLDGGESVRVIGFPGTDFWTVGGGTIARIEGRNLVFSGDIRGGNSGGPVIYEGTVIGLVTDVIISVTQVSAFAARGEALEPYINGIKPNLVPHVGVVLGSSICQTLNSLLDESRNGFYGIVGTPTSSDGVFSPKLMVPGASVGYVTPPKKIYYYMLTSKRRGDVESEFYATVTKVRQCSTSWEQKEATDSSYKYHKFRKTRGGVVVSVYYNPTAQRDTYYLMLDLAVPDAQRSEW